jgi:hypothetical protein
VVIKGLIHGCQSLESSFMSQGLIFSPYHGKGPKTHTWCSKHPNGPIFPLKGQRSMREVRVVGLGLIDRLMTLKVTTDN